MAPSDLVRWYSALCTAAGPPGSRWSAWVGSAGRETHYGDDHATSAGIIFGARFEAAKHLPFRDGTWSIPRHGRAQLGRRLPIRSLQKSADHGKRSVSRIDSPALRGYAHVAERRRQPFPLHLQRQLADRSFPFTYGGLRCLKPGRIDRRRRTDRLRRCRRGATPWIHARRPRCAVSMPGADDRGREGGERAGVIYTDAVAARWRRRRPCCRNSPSAETA